MFDFSFGEMLIIGTVALVVIGPERLPKVARTVGAMLARAQRYVNAVKADIQREVDLDNLRQIEAEMNEAGRKLTDELHSGITEVRESIHQGISAEPARPFQAQPPADPPVAAEPPPRDRR